MGTKKTVKKSAAKKPAKVKVVTEKITKEELVDLPGGLKVPKTAMQAALFVESNMISHYNNLVEKHNGLNDQVKILKDFVEKQFASIGANMVKLLESVGHGSIGLPAAGSSIAAITGPTSTANGEGKIAHIEDPLDII